MIISPLTPLFFDQPSGDGIKSRYIQTFAQTDVILVECICSSDETPAFELIRDGTPTSLLLNHWTLRNNIVLWFFELTGLDYGEFTLREATSGLVSRPFIVTNNSNDLRNTTLIQYSMGTNAKRDDTVFVIDGMKRFFDFRVPGGFKNTDWTFHVDNEQFTTSRGDLVTLYSLDTVQKKFTMGSSDGVPIEFAELLNRILTCTYVYFDGVRYERSGNSTPEITILQEGLDSFVFKTGLQKVNYLDPIIENSNIACLRRGYASDYYRTNTYHNQQTNLLVR